MPHDNRPLDFSPNSKSALSVTSALLVFALVISVSTAAGPSTNATAVDIFGNPWPCSLGAAWCTKIPINPLGLYVKLNCTGSCGQTYYCVDTMNVCTPDIPYNSAGPFLAGTAFVRFYTVNSSAGPNESLQSLMVRIDFSAPITKASAILANGSAYTFGYSTNQSVNVSLSCTATSGCSVTKYCTDPLNTCTPNTVYSVPVPITGTGTTYLRFNSTSVAGLTEAVKSAKIQNSTPPATTATGIKNNGSAYTMNTWTNANYVNVTLTCNDTGGPGCGTTLYCVYLSGGCTPSTIYTAPFKVGPLAIPEYVSFRSNDTAGIIEPTVTQAVLFDIEAPTTIATAVNSTYGIYTFGSVTTSPYVNVTLSCVDIGGSGCNATLYCNDTNNTCTPGIPYSVPVQVTTAGTSYLRYMSNDTAGNVEGVSSGTIILGSPCVTGADLNGDHIISLSELLIYIVNWKLNLVTITDLLKAIVFWKAGFGC
jgi:hypothetical protein